LENNSIDLNNFDIDEIKNDEELRESAIRYFDNIINEEMKKKTEEQNPDLIDDCIRKIALLKGVKAEFTEDELAEKAQQAINAVKAKMAAKKRARFKSLIAVAAAVALLGGTFVGAYAFSPQFKDWVTQLLDMPVGSAVTSGGITFINDGERETYDNITELMESLDIAVYYPEVLPDGIYIESISYIRRNNIIAFDFNSDSYSFTIDLNCANSFSPNNSLEIYTANNLSLYINKISDSVFYSVFYDEHNIYSITTPDIDSLKIIFDNLRGNIS